jgi:hypothetical protein
MTHRRYDLKSSSGHRQLQKHILDRADGPVVLLGVHLYGVLSIRAVQLFNDHPRCTFLALKPCCLPPIELAQWECVWHVGGHSFAAAEVCAAGKYNKGKWVGVTAKARKSHQAARFKVWMQHLFAGMVVGVGGDGGCDGDMDDGRDGTKEVRDIQLLAKYGDNGGHLKHYQTLFGFAQRPYRDVTGVVTDIGGESSRKHRTKRDKKVKVKVTRQLKRTQRQQPQQSQGKMMVGVLDQELATETANSQKTRQIL